MQYAKLVLAALLAIGVNAQSPTDVPSLGCQDDTILQPLLNESLQCAALGTDTAVLNCLCTGPFKAQYEAAYQCAATANGGTNTDEELQGHTTFQQSCDTNNPSLIGLPSSIAPSDIPTSATIATGTAPAAMTTDPAAAATTVSGATVMSPTAAATTTMNMTNMTMTTAAAAKTSAAATASATAAAQGSGAVKNVAGGLIAILAASVAALL
ncbi:hypothetical protein HDV00_012548 [Rhizophlyctis rosea]|nr:hypothetical protein HDV00_012548 [Rhizophlyctis rosea]